MTNRCVTYLSKIKVKGIVVIVMSSNGIQVENAMIEIRVEEMCRRHAQSSKDAIMLRFAIKTQHETRNFKILRHLNFAEAPL